MQSMDQNYILLNYLSKYIPFFPTQLDIGAHALNLQTYQGLHALSC